MRKNILFIGLNGYAGSGKDTVAKILRHILKNKNGWTSIEECKSQYKPNDPFEYATFNNTEDNFASNVSCIAFADQLKNICATMFGIPIERFYYNKANGWICINKDFAYTESKPNPSFIVTADDYYTGMSNYSNSQEQYWMSLRELLVYVGTYVCQRSINKEIFVNIVNNTINRVASRNSNLEYVIVTDIRFMHELEYIQNKSGVTIRIERDSVNVLDNIAEHDLDDSEYFDFVVDNNGTYDDLFKTIWDLIYDNAIFANSVIEIDSRDNINNYLRLVSDDDAVSTYHLCTEYPFIRVQHVNGIINMIDPAGGPAIILGREIDGTHGIVPSSIYTIEDRAGFYIDVKK